MAPLPPILSAPLIKIFYALNSADANENLRIAARA
jgi:hypothetical protein